MEFLFTNNAHCLCPYLEYIHILESSIEFSSSISTWQFDDTLKRRSVYRDTGNGWEWKVERDDAGWKWDVNWKKERKEGKMMKMRCEHWRKKWLWCGSSSSLHDGKLETGGRHASTKYVIHCINITSNFFHFLHASKHFLHLHTYPPTYLSTPP